MPCFKAISGLIFFVSLFLFSCAPSPIYYDIRGMGDIISNEKKGPVKVAILPFGNNTKEPGWEQILR